MVGEARPTDATANNAIIVLRNIIILPQRYSLPAAVLSVGGDHFVKSLWGFDECAAQLSESVTD
jgi:hypothetical protein